MLLNSLNISALRVRGSLISPDCVHRHSFPYSGSCDTFVLSITSKELLWWVTSNGLKIQFYPESVVVCGNT